MPTSPTKQSLPACDDIEAESRVQSESLVSMSVDLSVASQQPFLNPPKQEQELSFFQLLITCGGYFESEPAAVPEENQNTVKVDQNALLGLDADEEANSYAALPIPPLTVARRSEMEGNIKAMTQAFEAGLNMVSLVMAYTGAREAEMAVQRTLAVEIPEGGVVEVNEQVHLGFLPGLEKYSACFILTRSLCLTEEGQRSKYALLLWQRSKYALLLWQGSTISQEKREHSFKHFKEWKSLVVKLLREAKALSGEDKVPKIVFKKHEQLTERYLKHKMGLLL
eukprot:g77414.t1